MDGRIRNWAATGHYVDDGATPLDSDDALRPRPSNLRATSKLAFLMPVGMLCGALLAVACVARLLALPFMGRRGST